MQLQNKGEESMKIYVGYILSDYACPLFVSRDKTNIKKRLDEVDNRHKWIEEYELGNNNVIELDCD